MQEAKKKMKVDIIVSWNRRDTQPRILQEAKKKKKADITASRNRNRSSIGFGKKSPLLLTRKIPVQKVAFTAQWSFRQAPSTGKPSRRGVIVGACPETQR